MKGSRQPLPTLLAVSVAAALGHGSALASRMHEPSSGSSTTSSWECTAALNQDWNCSSGLGKPYNSTLENVSQYRRDSQVRSRAGAWIQSAPPRAVSRAYTETEPYRPSWQNAGASDHQQEVRQARQHDVGAGMSHVSSVNLSEPTGKPIYERHSRMAAGTEPPVRIKGISSRMVSQPPTRRAGESAGATLSTQKNSVGAGLGYSLLSHQAHQQPLVSHNRPVSSYAPAAMLSGRAVTTVPGTQHWSGYPDMVPRAAYRSQPLPDLEVTPAERLARAVPQPRTVGGGDLYGGDRMPGYSAAPSGSALYSAPRPSVAWQPPSGQAAQFQGRSVANHPYQSAATEGAGRQRSVRAWPEPRYRAERQLAPDLTSVAQRSFSSVRMADSATVTPSMPPSRRFRDMYKQEQMADRNGASRSEGEPRAASDQPLSSSGEFIGSGSVERLRYRAHAAMLSTTTDSHAPVGMEREGGSGHAATHSMVAQDRAVSVRELLMSPPGSFSIQWFATTQSSQLERLKRHFPLLQKTTTVRFNHGGQIWHALMSGVFPDRASAMASLQNSQWRTLAARLKPWARILDDLQVVNLPDEWAGAMAEHSEQSASAGLIRASDTGRQAQSAPSALPQGEYTLQWFAADSPDPLWALRTRYPYLRNSEVVMIPAGMEDTRYLLIQGRFADGVMAMRSVHMMPSDSPVVQLNPQPRPMASLKKAVRLDDKPLYAGLQEEMSYAGGQDEADGAYTIQWIGAHNPAVLHQLQARYAALQSAEMVHFRDKGLDWYLLVQGRYASAQQAEEALAQPELARLVSHLRPWPRSIDGLEELTGGQQL